MAYVLKGNREEASFKWKFLEQFVNIRQGLKEATAFNPNRIVIHISVYLIPKDQKQTFPLFSITKFYLWRPQLTHRCYTIKIFLGIFSTCSSTKGIFFSSLFSICFANNIYLSSSIKFHLAYWLFKTMLILYIWTGEIVWELDAFKMAYNMLLIILLAILRLGDKITWDKIATEPFKVFHPQYRNVIIESLHNFTHD